MKNVMTCVDIGFAGLLTIAFIVLKLTGLISWPWVWVLSPLWIWYCIVILVFAITVFVAILKKYGLYVILQ